MSGFERCARYRLAFRIFCLAAACKGNLVKGEEISPAIGRGSTGEAVSKVDVSSRESSLRGCGRCRDGFRELRTKHALVRAKDEYDRIHSLPELICGSTDKKEVCLARYFDTTDPAVLEYTRICVEEDGEAVSHRIVYDCSATTSPDRLELHTLSLGCLPNACSSSAECWDDMIVAGPIEGDQETDGRYRLWQDVFADSFGGEFSCQRLRLEVAPDCTEDAHLQHFEHPLVDSVATIGIQ